MFYIDAYIRGSQLTTLPRISRYLNLHCKITLFKRLLLIKYSALVAVAESLTWVCLKIARPKINWCIMTFLINTVITWWPIISRQTGKVIVFPVSPIVVGPCCSLTLLNHVVKKITSNPRTSQWIINSSSNPAQWIIPDAAIVCWFSEQKPPWWVGFPRWAYWQTVDKALLHHCKIFVSRSGFHSLHRSKYLDTGWNAGSCPGFHVGFPRFTFEKLQIIINHRSEWKPKTGL